MIRTICSSQLLRYSCVWWIVGIGVATKGDEVFLATDAEEPGRRMRLKTDAISLNDGEGMARIFYWQRGRLYRPTLTKNFGT